MKKFLFFLLFSFGALLIPANVAAQKRDTGNWELGFYGNANDDVREPYYQVIIPGFRSDNKKEVKLVIKVDYAVVNGFTLSLLDEKNEQITDLGFDTKIGYSEDWRTEKRIKNFIKVDRNYRAVCYLESQSSVNELADLLCKEDFAIFLISTNRNGESVMYAMVVNNETQKLMGAIHNLLEMYNACH